MTSMKKKYIQPAIMVTKLNMRPLMQRNSLTSVTGLDDVEISQGEFGGGTADSRRRRSVWGDEEEDEW